MPSEVLYRYGKPSLEIPGERTPGVSATIVQPDGDSKIFNLDKVTGTITYPIEESKFYLNTGGKYKICFNNLIKDAEFKPDMISIYAKIGDEYSFYTEPLGK